MIHRDLRLHGVLRLLFVLTSVLTLVPAPGDAQARARWNGPHVMELVRRARALRRSTRVDPAMRSYEADARGYLYFFIDRKDTGQRTLVKADQIALDVYWQAPDETAQRIVGRRDRKLLPTDIHYHIDHMTVVQDDFGDRIRIGGGAEVSSVMHPLAPGSSSVYDFLLADSLNLTYGDGNHHVRVYEVRVRPKDLHRPGFIGSVYLDRATAAIVRMDFTFTPASYVDPSVDHIRISLDNSRWMGHFWLPYRQELEIRREIPVLDFMAGTIIRARFRIGSYRFNRVLAPTLFAGPRITAAPPMERQAFPFKRGLFADLDQRGLAPTPSVAKIQAEARQLVARQALSGLRPRRLYVHSISDVLRYDRAEGLRLGAGLEVHPEPDVALRTSAGWAFGRHRPSFELTARGAPQSVTPTLDAYWDALRDIGPVPAEAGALNTLSSALGGVDHLDPYFVRGMRLTLAGPRTGTGPSLSLRWEDQRSAHIVVSGASRPVRPVNDGVLGSVDARIPFALPGSGAGEVTATFGRLRSRTFGTALATARWTLRGAGHSWALDMDASTGAVSREAPAQDLFLLGGLGTLPGYPFRSFVGDAFGLAQVAGTLPLLPPWVGIRGIASVGYTHLDPSRVLPAGWEAHDSGGLRPSVGVGLSLAWDVLRLDLARGLRGGHWQLVFSVDPRFSPWL